MKRTILVALCLLGLCSCGGGGAPTLAPAPPSGNLNVGQITTGSDLSLGVLRSTSGVPQGVRVTWPRVDVVGVQGYYIYRDTNPFVDGPPTGLEGLRVNGGGIINSGNPGAGTAPQTFDDLFGAQAGTKYYYRLTVVNSTGDESDLSAEISITIAQQTITTISQTGGDIGDQVTINGTWFGATRNGDTVFFSDSTGQVVVPVAAADYVSWSQTQIVVKVPYGAADGNVGVLVGTIQVNSPNGQVFNYNEPVLTTVAPGSDWAENGWVTLTGSHFGPAPNAGGTATKVWFGNVAALDSDIDMPSWSATNIKLKVPVDAPGQALQIKVDIAGNLSGGQPFTVLPRLTGFDLTTAKAGANVVLQGSGFGTTQGTGTVTFNGATASIVSWTNTAVTATVPDDALDGAVELTRDDAAATNTLDFDVIPRIDGIDPFRRMLGEQVTITGGGFGAVRGTSSLTFLGGNIAALNFLSWSPTQIVITVPPGALTGNLRLHIADDPVGADNDSVDSATTIKIIPPPPGGWGPIGQL